MKISQIITNESVGATCAGSVATVSKPIGEVQKRTDVPGLQPAEKVMKGKAKKKGPYQNSIIEEGKKDSVVEADLNEEDKIIDPTKGKKLKTGLHGKGDKPKFSGFVPPFKSSGVFVSDKRGNKVCECEKQEVAPMVAKALSAYAIANESAGVLAGGLQYEGEELNELSPQYIKGKMKDAFKREKEKLAQGDVLGAVQTGKRIASVQSRLQKREEQK